MKDQKGESLANLGKQPQQQKQKDLLESILSESDIAFGDSEVLKSSISKSEFESVIKMLTKVYDDVNHITMKRQKAKKEAKESLLSMKDSGMPENMFSHTVKSTKLLIYEADKMLSEKFRTEYENINKVTDFLNIFRNPNDQLSNIDVSFIDKFKEK